MGNFFHALLLQLPPSAEMALSPPAQLVVGCFSFRGCAYTIKSVQEEWDWMDSVRAISIRANEWMKSCVFQVKCFVSVMTGWLW